MNEKQAVRFRTIGDITCTGAKLSTAENIDDIIDNPFCPDDTSCAIVISTVCVMLEAGDDEMEVTDALLDGIKDSINGGEFDAAIPPEHRLPGVR